MRTAVVVETVTVEAGAISMQEHKVLRYGLPCLLQLDHVTHIPMHGAGAVAGSSCC